MDTVDIDTIDDEDVLKQMVCIIFHYLVSHYRFLIKIEFIFAVASDGGFR